MSNSAVTVSILGKKYELSGDSDVEIRTLAANLLRQKLSEIQRLLPKASVQDSLVLTALNIAEEYLIAIKNYQDNYSEMQDKINKLMAIIEKQVDATVKVK